MIAIMDAGDARLLDRFKKAVWRLIEVLGRIGRHFRQLLVLMGGQGATWRGMIALAFLLALSVVILAVIHHLEGEPGWVKHVPASDGSDGILWQVQTTVLSVGFAGLAIAAQLFAESPLAIGASRGRILEHVGAGWFVGIGLVANAVIAIETIWFPSDIGVLGVAVFWFVPSVTMLVLSYANITRLFGHPSRLDEVVRISLVETVASRLDAVSRRYAEAQGRLDGLFESGLSVESLRPSSVTLRVAVPRAGLVIRAIKPQFVQQAMALLAPHATDASTPGGEGGDLYTPDLVTLDVEPGDRTRLGETAFRVSMSHDVDMEVQDRLVRLLQSSIEFESPGTVTPDEETDREIATLKDTIGTSLRSGAYGTAERALMLLGQVVRGVWTARPVSLGSSRRSSFTRRQWLFRSIGEVEQDALLSPRAAGLFVGQAMTRAIEAPRTGLEDYVDECLRSFTRLWSDVLRYGGAEFDSLPSNIVTCVQNLAAYSYSEADQRDDLRARATWALVELVKLALDAMKPNSAALAARELDGLFEYGDPGGSGRVHVRGGQLVLSGWLDYLAAKKDQRDPADAELRALVTPRGTWSEILNARTMAERGAAPFSRWDWWEMKISGSLRAQVLELSHYIDRAEMVALASSSGGLLPPAADMETAAEYKRFMRLLDEGGDELSVRESEFARQLGEAVRDWDEDERDRLAREPLSKVKIAALEAALRETLDAGQRLAAKIPTVAVLPDVVDGAHPVLGMNVRVTKHFLVDDVFNQTHADPRSIGQMIARGFADGEDRRIVAVLRGQQSELLDLPGQALRHQIEALGDEDAKHYILATPYGGLMDIGEWPSAEFRQALSRVTHIETAALENEVILFDRRAVTSKRRPEVKDRLSPVEGTSISLGVFEDVKGQGEPQVRIEAGEYLVVWAAEARHIFRYGKSAPADARTHPSV
jgi:hypothetical protein